MGQVLHWSAAWADIVGGDGPIITDLLGRIVPSWTDADAANIKKADLARYSTVHTSLQRADGKAGEVADANALRTALACARQSADRVIDAIVPYDPTGGTNDRWHLWSYPRRALDGAVSALVIRRAAPPELVAVLAALWCDVFGPLPAYADLDTEVPPIQTCPECGHPEGARVVTEAEAARYARHLETGMKHAVEWAKQDAAKARRSLAEFTRTHLAHDQVRELIQQELDGTPGLSSKAREHLAKRFGITSVRPEEPVQAALFGGAA